jgi:hypothetical protein
MRSSLGQLSDFFKGNIWKDIEEELDIWLDEVRDQLENTDLNFSHRTLDQLGGCAKALRNVKMIGEVLIALAEDNIEIRKQVTKNLSRR